MKILLSIIAIYVALAILLLLTQRSHTYFPSKDRPTTSAWHAQSMQEITLTTNDGLKLFAWYQPAQKGKPTLVYFHGNAGHIGHRVFLTKRYRQDGYGLLLVEYRGFGANPGKPTEKGLYQDAAAAMDFLEQRGIAPNCTILYGESIGTAVAIETAMKYPVAALILQSPFTSLADMASHHYFFFPTRWFLLESYDSKSKIKTLNIPVLITYADDDAVVPAKFSKALYEAANEPKQLLGVKGLGHNDFYLQSEYPKVIQFINEHVREHCKSLSS